MTPNLFSPEHYLADLLMSGQVVSRILIRPKPARPTPLGAEGYLWPKYKNTSVLALLDGQFWHRLLELGVQNLELTDSIQGVSQAVFTGMAPNTIKAYTRWLQKFQEFCQKIALEWKETSYMEVAVFLQSLVDHRPAGMTVAQAAAAIS